MQQLLLELAPPPAPTLENFVPGRNGASLAALRAAIAGGEPRVYLWGAAGSGRTHLLRGFVRAAGPARAAGYFAAAAADWRDASALQFVAADDVESLSHEDQIAVFDLCNRLRASGGVLLAAGNAPPAQLALRADLRTRLAAGIVIQVHPLSDAEKAAALASHAAGRGIALSDDLTRYLLGHFERDMATQIALLDALDRYSLEHKRPITLPLLKQALRSLEPRKTGS